MDADEVETKVAWQLQAEEEALRPAEAWKEKDDLQQEGHKKNQSKFLPIPNQPVLQRALVIITQTASAWTKVNVSPYGIAPAEV